MKLMYYIIDNKKCSILKQCDLTFISDNINTICFLQKIKNNKVIINDCTEPAQSIKGVHHTHVAY